MLQNGHTELRKVCFRLFEICPKAYIDTSGGEVCS